VKKRSSSTNQLAHIDLAFKVTPVSGKKLKPTKTYGWFTGFPAKRVYDYSKFLKEKDSTSAYLAFIL